MILRVLALLLNKNKIGGYNTLIVCDANDILRNTLGNGVTVRTDFQT